jgi:hypothetical protein
MWVALANRTLSIHAVSIVAVLGQWQPRTSRRQNRPELQAETQNANLELRHALARTEAAEAQARRRQHLLTLNINAAINTPATSVPGMGSAFTFTLALETAADTATTVD